MITPEELEIALEDKGWEPDYREVSGTGKELAHPIYEVLVDNRPVSIELTSLNSDNEIVLARIWEWDEDEEGDDVWDVEDVSNVEAIIAEVESYVASV